MSPFLPTVNEDNQVEDAFVPRTLSAALSFTPNSSFYHNYLAIAIAHRSVHYFSTHTAFQDVLGSTESLFEKPKSISRQIQYKPKPISNSETNKPSNPSKDARGFEFFNGLSIANNAKIVQNLAQEFCKTHADVGVREYNLTLELEVLCFDTISQITLGDITKLQQERVREIITSEGKRRGHTTQDRPKWSAARILNSFRHSNKSLKHRRLEAILDEVILDKIATGANDDTSICSNHLRQFADRDDLSENTKAQLITSLSVQLENGFEGLWISLQWAFYAVSFRKDIQANIAKEAQAALFSETNTPNHLELRLTEAAISESMRLYPTIPNFVRRISGAIVVDRLTLHAGDYIVLPVIALHRHRKLWKNPDYYDPQRFLSANVDRLNYYPYGFGPRHCPGSNISLIAMKLIVATVLAKFEFTTHAYNKPSAIHGQYLYPEGNIIVDTLPRN